jgi:cold-inducible RNA-binding protein
MQSVARDSWARLNPHGSGLSAEPDGMRGFTGVYPPKRFWHCTKQNESNGATAEEWVLPIKRRWTNQRRKGEVKDMAKKLFVGGLSWDTTDEGLRQAFAPHGEITEAKVITDRGTGRSRGFGFVTFAQDEDAKSAISKMDGTSLDGKTIKVNEAQEKSPRSGGRSGGGFGGGRGGGRDRW